MLLKANKSSSVYCTFPYPVLVIPGVIITWGKKLQ